MSYLKLFSNHNQYETFISDEAALKPNVSCCIQENDIHYNSLFDSRLIITYNVPDASNPTQLYTYINQQGYPFTVLGIDMFDNAEIDGVEVSIADLDNAQGTYQFSTAGEHTVKYTLKDPTFIGAEIDEETETETITKLGALFMQCPSVISVNIPNSVTTIGVSAFNTCTGLTSVTIPNSVTSIGVAAFQFCSGLASITIPNSVTSIGNQTFDGCSDLTSVTIPNSVTSIGNYSFSNCISLSSVTIGSGIRTISEGAFGGCSNLSSVTVVAATPPILNDFVFDGVSGNMRIYVPVDSVSAYKNALGWSEYESKIEAIQ